MVSRLEPISLSIFLLALVTVAAAPAQDGAALYAEGCQACHGVDGRGLAPDHPSYASFDPPPADLTDPLFNSREPSADWFLVVKHGGPSLGFSDQMPAYGSVWSDAQIESVVAFLKRLAATEGYPPGDLNFPRPVRTIKAFPEDEVLVLSRYDSNDDADDALRTTLYFAHRLGRRFQIEIKGTTIDLGAEGHEEELELGLKWAFQHDLDRTMINAVGLESEIPLDGGDEVIIPYWSLGKGLGDSFTLQSTLRSHLPTADVDTGDVELSAAVHWLPSLWARYPAPALELRLVQPFEGGDLESTVIPQALVGLSKRGHVSLALGAELPLSDRDWGYRLHAFLLWDYADGVFWRGF